MAVKKLDAIAKEIQGALKTSIESRIEVGRLLNTAREFFQDKKSFGDWVSGNFPDQIDPKTLNNYRRLALCFSDKLPENIPLSGLYELSAPKNDSYRDAALDSLKGKDKVSLKDVQAAIEKAKTDQPAPSDLEDVLSKVAEMSEQDSCEVLMKIVENIGITKVHDWLDMVDLDKEKAA